MKKLFLISIISLISCVLFAEPQQSKKQYQVVGVAFYNLENLFDTINTNGSYDLEYSPAGAKKWDGRKYWSKIANMSYAISQLATERTPGGPAIIGVSEIENESVLKDLVKADPIKKWMLQVVHHDSPDRRGVDVALLYNPRYFRMLNVNNHRLKIEGYDSFRTRDQMCVTGILMGDTVSVIVNHWPSRMGGQAQSSYLREAAAALSKQIADSVWAVNPHQSVIVMGDLNDDPFDKSCAEVLGAKKDKKDVDYHGFYNPFWAVSDKGIGSLGYRGSWNLFDQIILSGDLVKEGNGLMYWNCLVHNLDFLTGNEGNRQGYPLRTFASGVYLNGYSDHYPTQVFLVKPVK